MYRFALRPLWLLGHVVVLVLAVVLLSLGLWQLRRLDARRDANAHILRNSRSTAVLDSVVRPEQPKVPDDARFRRVEVHGTFDAGNEVLVRFRSSDGLPGYEVLTPLVVGTRTAVMVDRGWVPLEVGDAPSSSRTAPPTGDVTVTGLLLRGEGASRFRPEKRDDGRLVVGAVHTVGLEERLPYDLYPGFVQLQQPDDPENYPVPLDDPDPSEGPHLTYALQWFAFTVIAVVGWLLLVRQSARRRASPSVPST